MRFTLRTALIVFVAGLVCPLGRADDLIDKQAEEIFLEDDSEIRNGLPELVAQLNIPAGLVFGPLKYPWVPEETPKYEQVRMQPADQYLKVFEFRSGTMKAALEAFCRPRPAITWMQTEGVVLIRRQGPDLSHCNSVLNRRVDAFRVSEVAFRQVIARLKDSVTPPLESEVQGEPKWSIYGVQTRHVTGWHNRHEPVYGRTFEPRLPDTRSVTVAIPDGTLQQALNALSTQCQGTFWGVWEREPGPGTPKPLLADTPVRSGVLALFSFHPERREFDLPTLVRCIDGRYEHLHGYANREVRINDAWAELWRRQHFHLNAVRRALVQNNALERILASPRYEQRMRRVSQYFLMSDEAMARRAVERILHITEDEPARRRPLVCWSIPFDPRYHPEDTFKSTYVPVWRRLAEEDKDPKVRERAREILEYYEDWKRHKEGASRTSQDK